MKEIAIIGMGTMGSAIQELLQEDFTAHGITRHDSLASVQSAETVLLAIKPQSFHKLAESLVSHIDRKQTVISIMAGITLRGLTEGLGTDRVVRTMPNLALKTGKSMTAWYAENSEVDLDTMQAILDSWGSSIELDREGQFDAFTALAGSGPAYFFELAHQLEQAALVQGFTAQQAQKIVTQTFRGTASVLSDGDTIESWVKRVASKGGTTEKALGVLSEQHFEQTIGDAVMAATVRSRELGQG
jgi:pyrroline-5-carboxylate reductase